MPDLNIVCTPSAYDYPLLIKNLLFSPVVDAPEQEIVYRGTFRYTASCPCVLRPGSKISAKDISSHVKGYTDKQVILLKVHFVESIDKTSVGKISKVMSGRNTRCKLVVATPSKSSARRM
jgi:hypothetical protein